MYIRRCHSGQSLRLPIMALAGVVLLCVNAAVADDAAVGGVESSEVVDGIELRYVIRDGACEIGTLSGKCAVSNDTVGAVRIPERLGGHAVGCVMRGAFSGCGRIEFVSLPPRVELIGSGAFVGCSNLRFIALSDGLKTLSPYMFAESGLESIDIPSGVSRIRQYAFLDCSRLHSVNLRRGLVEIGEMAFGRCRSLEEIIVPDTVTNIARYAFANCERMTNVVFGCSLGEIGDQAFYNCRGLHSVRLPKGLRFLRNGVFEDCSLLTDVVLSEGMVELGDEAFCGCAALQRLVLPRSLEDIGRRAFADCAFDSINLPNGIKTVGEYAFSGCAWLQECRISETVTNMGKCVFQGCRSLKKIMIDPANRCFRIDDGELLSIDGRRLLCVFGRRGSYRISGGVDAVDCSFDTLPEMHTLIIPPSISNMWPKVIAGAYGLTNIVVESGNGVFSSTGGMLLDASGRNLLACAGGVKDVVVTGGVENISAFALQRHQGLMTCRIAGVATVGEYAFSICDGLREIHIDADIIGKGAFAQNRSLRLIEFGREVRELGAWQFDGDARLNQVCFLGDAPSCDEDLFEGTQKDLVVVVQRGSVGWGVDGNGNLPATWRGRRIRYAESMTPIED